MPNLSNGNHKVRTIKGFAWPSPPQSIASRERVPRCDHWSQSHLTMLLQALSTAKNMAPCHNSILTRGVLNKFLYNRWSINEFHQAGLNRAPYRMKTAGSHSSEQWALLSASDVQSPDLETNGLDFYSSICARYGCMTKVASV